MLEASVNAINDAGLKPHDIDGIIGPPLGAASEHIAANLGIEDMRYATTVHMGGASPVVSLQSAAMAIASGVATNVLIPVGWNGYSSNPVRGGGARADTGEKPMPAPNPLQNTIGAFYLPYGATVPVQWYAWLATRHKQLYGTPLRGDGRDRRRRAQARPTQREGDDARPSPDARGLPRRALGLLSVPPLRLLSRDRRRLRHRRHLGRARAKI